MFSELEDVEAIIWSQAVWFQNPRHCKSSINICGLHSGKNEYMSWGDIGTQKRNNPGRNWRGKKNEISGVKKKKEAGNWELERGRIKEGKEIWNKKRSSLQEILT